MKNIHFLFVFISILCVSFSCNRAPEIDDSKVFRLNQYENVSSLDPAFARSKSNNWMCNLMYNGLVNFNDSLEVVPDIAKSWDISADGLAYTFHLRNDVYFHDDSALWPQKNRKVTAHDFEFSFQRLTNPKVGSSGGFVLNNVASYKALNDSTFYIQLQKPFPPFLGLLCMKYCSVVPKEAFTEDGSKFKNKPIGTGPFKYKLWEDNVKLVFAKHTQYHHTDSKGTRLPYLDYVAVTFLPEKHGEFLQLIQGKIDMLSSLDPSYKDELLTPTGQLNPKYKQSIQMIKAPYLNTEYLCFYMDDEKPLSTSLRKAINMAIDKKKMIEFLRNNVGFAANGGFIPKGLPGHQPELGDGYQPEKAKELIANYLAENGKIPEITLVTTQEYADICEYAQAQLQKVGLAIEVNIVDPPTLREGKANGKFAFFRANWGADYPDAENFLSLFYSKNFAPNGPNYSHYQNPLFDQWYEEALEETLPAKRTLLYQKMDSLVMHEMPIIPTFYDQSTTFLRKNVKGFQPNPINLLDLSKVKKVTEKQ